MKKMSGRMITRIFVCFGLLLVLLAGKMFWSQRTEAAEIKWKCMNPKDIWIDEGTYMLGAFLHYGTSESVRKKYWNNGKKAYVPFQTSVAVSLVPYLKSKIDGKEYIFIKDRRDEDFYALACGEVDRNYIIENFNAKLYPEVWLLPGHSSLQASLFQALLEREDREWLLQRIEIKSGSFTTIKELLISFVKKMQEEGTNIPFLNISNWSNGSIKFEKFRLFDNDLNLYDVDGISEFSYIPKQDKMKAITIILPEGLRAYNLSDRITLPGDCTSHQRIDNKNDENDGNYEIRCGELPESLKIQGFREIQEAPEAEGENFRWDIGPEQLIASFMVKLESDEETAYKSRDASGSEVVINSNQREVEFLVNYDDIKDGRTFAVVFNSPTTNEPIRKDFTLNELLQDPLVVLHKTEQDNFQLTLQLPEQFQQLGDISENIQLGECIFTHSDEGSEVYTASCPEPVPPTMELSIDGFLWKDGVSVSPEENIVITAEQLLAQFTLNLPRHIGIDYTLSSAGAAINIERGKPAPLKIPLKAISIDSPYNLEFQITGIRERSCKFDYNLTLSELGSTITLEPPCQENTMTFAEGIPLPERAEPCLNWTVIGNGVVSCLRKTSEDLTLTWEREARISPMTIPADTMNSPELATPIDSVDYTYYNASLTLPDFFQGDLSNRISLDGCVQPTFLQGSTYMTECDRQEYEALTEVKIRDLVDLPLEKVFVGEQGTHTQNVILQATGNDRSIPVSVVLSLQSGLNYQIGDMAVQPGQPFDYQMKLTEPSIHFSTSNPRYAECSFEKSLQDVARVLRGETFDFTPPCRLNTLHWTTGYPRPRLEGCLVENLLTDNSLQCLRRTGESLIRRWGVNDNGTELSQMLDSALDVEISIPPDRFPVKINTTNSNIDFGFDKKFLLFPSLDSCENAELSTVERNFAEYTAATVETLWAREEDWAVVAKGDSRLSQCTQGTIEGANMLFNIQSNSVPERHMIIAIENSSDLAEQSRGNALKEGLLTWLSELRAEGGNLQLSVLKILGDGRLEKVLDGEELIALPLHADAGNPSVYARISEAFNFRDEGFQPLKHLDSIDQTIVEQGISGDILYFSAGRGLPSPINKSHVGTLLGWKLEGRIGVTIVTSGSCENWGNDQFVACQFLKEYPTTDEIVSIFEQLKTGGDNQ